MELSSRIGRHSPAHPPAHEESGRATIIFLTVCAANRRPILAQTDIVAHLVACWQKADAWLVGRYMVMPDHIHLFCAPARRPGHPLIGWMRYWKSMASRSWPRPDEQPVWQRDGWDTQLRQNDSYSGKWEYVLNNPVRARLVEYAEEWPHQGELNVLRW